MVGSLGTDAAFRAPYLDNSLAVWDGEAIAGVESGQIRQLSCGYHYDADMTPGEFEGVAYDGVMRNIGVTTRRCVETAAPVMMFGNGSVRDGRKLKGNHMVKQVATITPRTAVAMGALQVYLPPKLAADAKLPISGGCSAARRADKEIVSRVDDGDEAAAGERRRPVRSRRSDRCAQGSRGKRWPRRAEGPQAVKTANPDDTGLGDPEGTNEAMLSEDDDLEEKVRELLAGKLDDADLEMLMKLISPADDDDATADPDASADPDDLGAPSADPPDTAPPEAKPDV